MNENVTCLTSGLLWFEEVVNTCELEQTQQNTVSLLLATVGLSFSFYFSI